MPRVYQRLGDKKRSDAVTALFTHAERLRVEEAAREANVPLSVFVHHAVLARLGATNLS
jgi:hypothetical protein